MTTSHRICRVLVPAILLSLSGSVACAQQETPFGAAGEWSVTAATSGDRLAYCTARRTIDGRAVRMRFDGTDWTFALEVGRSGTQFSAFDVDDASFPADGGHEEGFAFVTLDLTALESIRNGSLATLVLDGTEIEVPLNGTGAAALRVQDCVREDGIAPAPAELLVVPGPPGSETGPMGAECPDRKAAESVWDGQPDRVTLTYVAETNTPALQLFWVDPFGRLLPVPVSFDGASASLTLDAYAGQTFVARDASGACHGGLIRATGSGASYSIP